MAHDQQPMKQALLEALKNMNEASALLDQIVQSIKLDNSGTPVEQVMEIKQSLASPEWLLTTHNHVEGVIGGGPVKLVATIDFLLDTRTLFISLNKQPSFDPKNLDIILARLKSKPQGDTLAGILTNSLLPHAYCLTSRIELPESIPHVQAVGLVEEIGLMTARDGLVHFNYAHVLSRFLPGTINLDHSLFNTKVWVNVEFLAGSDPFEKTFAYEDTSNGEPLNVSLELKFSRLK
jgi:hypothetical protein